MCLVLAAYFIFLGPEQTYKPIALEILCLHVKNELE